MFDYPLVQILLDKLSAVSMVDWLHFFGYTVVAIGIFEAFRILKVIHDTYGPK